MTLRARLQLLLVILASLALLSLLYVSTGLLRAPEEAGAASRAASVTPVTTVSAMQRNCTRILYYDSLAVEYPNRTLLERLEGIVSEFHACLDAYIGEEAGLKPLLMLTRYDIVVVRAHGGIWDSKGFYIATGLGPTGPFDVPLNLVRKWSSGGVIAAGAPAVMFRGGVVSSREYVVVGPEFFEKIVAGKRRHGVAIIMACDSLSDPRFIAALAAKGYDVYFGWRGLVTPEDIDAVLPRLVGLVLEGWSDGLRGCKLQEWVLERLGSLVMGRSSGALLSGVCG